MQPIPDTLKEYLWYFEDSIEEVAKLKIFYSVVCAVHKLNKNGYVLHDISLENVWRNIDKNDNRVLILDHSFTIEKSRLYEEADPSIWKNLPSESFAEIVWYSSKGDVYNLGLLLYQIEFGTHPFDNIEDET